MLAGLREIRRDLQHLAEISVAAHVDRQDALVGRARPQHHGPGAVAEQDAGVAVGVATMRDSTSTPTPARYRPCPSG